MITEWNCLNCDSEINSETNIVFCDENCLEEYIEDRKDLESFLYKNVQKELE